MADYELLPSEDLDLEPLPSLDLSPEAGKAGQVLKTGLLVGAGVIGGSILTDYLAKQFKLSEVVSKVVETAIGVLAAGMAAKRKSEPLFYVSLGVAVDGLRGLILTFLPTLPTGGQTQGAGGTATPTALMSIQS